MIRQMDGVPEGVLGFEATGKLTTADYTDVLNPALDAADGKVRIVLVFSGEFDGLEAGALWQDLKLGVGKWTAWERIALVTDHRWMRDGLKLFGWAVPGQVAAFELSQQAEAMAWAAADSS